MIQSLLTAINLFGSFSESTCAAILLIVSEDQLFNKGNKDKMWLPIMISAQGVIACLITSIVGILLKVKEINKIQRALNQQLILSTVITLVQVWIICVVMLPTSWTEYRVSSFDKVTKKKCYWWYFAISITMGQISGLLIGISTDYNPI